MVRLLLELNENPSPRDRVPQYAAEMDCRDILELLYDAGCDCTGIAERAAVGNSLSCLRYAYEMGHTMTSGVATAACARGGLECLRFAHEHGGPLSVQAIVAAVKGNHWGCVKYLLDHGCPLNPVVLEVVCQTGDLRTMRRLHKVEGVPLDNTCAWQACKHGHTHVLKYIRDTRRDYITQSLAVQCSMWNRPRCLKIVLKCLSSGVRKSIRHRCANLSVSVGCGYVLDEMDPWRSDEQKPALIVVAKAAKGVCARLPRVLVDKIMEFLYESMRRPVSVLSSFQWRQQRWAVARMKAVARGSATISAKMPPTSSDPHEG